MSRKNRPHYHDPVSSVPATEDVGGEVPVEDTLEVGAIMLVEEPMPDGSVGTETVFLMDGPAAQEPLGIGDVMEPSDIIEFGVVAEYSAVPETTPYTSGSYLEETPNLQDNVQGFTDKANDFQSKAADVAGTVQDKAADVADAVQDKAQDMAQNVTSTAQDIAGKAQDIAGKAQDAAGDLAGKAQDAASTVADKAQDAVSTIADKAHDTAQIAADKAKDAAQTIAAKAESAKAAAADAGKKSKGAVAGAAGAVGMGLWSIVQRSPLQAIVFLSSLVWLLRNNSATASQTPVSVGEAAEKVGTLSGQVQVAAGNLGSQVKTQAQHGAGWFSTTLQENPLVIGAMALVAGLGLGLAVPETSYENKTLGKTRDQLLDKGIEAASDLTQKVTAVAHTAVQGAVETAKTEAKNQGLTPQDEASQAPPAPEQPQSEQAQQQ